MIRQVTDISFEEDVLKSDVPVLVEFHAAWCGPCRAMEPLLQLLSAEYNPGLLIAMVDVDESPRLTARYRINAYPSLILLKKGRILEQMSGVGRFEEIAGLIERNLGKIS